MSERAVHQAIALLRESAAEAEAGWLPEHWLVNQTAAMRMRRREVQLQSVGLFDEIKFKPGEVVEYSTDLELPERVLGVDLEGEPLEIVLNSFFPTQIEVDGETLFDDSLPVVACGPAQLNLVRRLRKGNNGQLVIRVQMPGHDLPHPFSQIGLMLQLTTPSLRSRFELLDQMLARLLIAEAFASTSEERDRIDRVGSLFTTLDSANLNDLRTLEGHVSHQLADLCARSAEYVIHCIGHSHIDLEWLWRWEDAREVIRRDARTVLELMKLYPEFRFTHSQPAGYQFLQREEPELFEQIKLRVAEGQWEPATIQWVEGDTNLASGPAQAAQISEAARFTQDELGATSHVHLAPDTFGHAGNIPQLSAAGGATVYYHYRGNPGRGQDNDMWPAYWWEGDDGTRLLAISSNLYTGPISASRVARTLIDSGLRHGLQDVSIFFGVGDHGGGPTRQDLEMIRKLAKLADFPSVRCSTVTDFASSVRTDILPTHRGESITVFEAAYISHADAKMQNRRMENALVEAGNLTAVANLDCADELSELWRTALFHQFHDTIAGTAVRPVYEDSKRRADGVIEAAGRLIDRARAKLATGEGQIVVTNPIGHDRFDSIRVPSELIRERESATAIGADGNAHPIQRTATGEGVFCAPLAPFETAAFQIEAEAEVGQLPQAQVGVHSSPTYAGADYITLDTPYYYVQVRRDCGVITTLYDKTWGRELVGYASARAIDVEQVRPDLAMGALQLLDEHPHEMSSWAIDEVFREESLLRDAKTDIVESGRVRIVLETRHAFRSSSALVRKIFWMESPQIDIEVEVDWQESGGPSTTIPSLVMSFGSRLARVEAWYETPFSAAERPADGLVVPALRWVDIGNGDGGITVLNDSKYGWEALGPRMRVHLARGSYAPDPEGDRGIANSARFGIRPHAGSWRDSDVVAHAAALNHPLAAVKSGTLVDPEESWRPRLARAGTAAIAEIRLVDGDRIIRVYETCGLRTEARLVGLIGKEIWRTDLRGRLLSTAPIVNGELELTFGPFEVITLRCPREDDR